MLLFIDVLPKQVVEKSVTPPLYPDYGSALNEVAQVVEPNAELIEKGIMRSLTAKF